jgi:TonB family protein
MIRSALILALAMPAAFAPDAPNPTELLAREGDWEINYDRDSCQLLAQFGKDDKKVILHFLRYQPSDRFRLVLHGKRLPKSESVTEAKIDFGLGAKPEAREAMLGTTNGLPSMFFDTMRIDAWKYQKGVDAPDITPAQEAAVTGVTVAIRGKSFRLATGSLRKPMAALRTCTTDLIESWGYDPKVQAGLTRKVTATGSPGNWLTSNDFPSAALRNGHNGLVQFRLDVNAEGKVAGCYVLERTSPDDFADLTCRALAKRATFLPALDAEGKPVGSYYVSQAKWTTN